MDPKPFGITVALWDSSRSGQFSTDFVVSSQAGRPEEASRLQPVLSTGIGSGLAFQTAVEPVDPGLKHNRSPSRRRRSKRCGLFADPVRLDRRPEGDAEDVCMPAVIAGKLSLLIVAFCSVCNCGC